MAAPKGNQFWKARSSHGRNPIFAAPEDLWTACVEYFEWVEENPLWEDKLVSYQGVTTHEPVCKMRAMTIGGLCIFLDISRRTWDEYRGREDYLPVVTRAEEIIRDQKFSGAAADLLNANIIARDLGLAEKQEHTGKDGGPIETKDTSDLEVARRVAFLLNKATRQDA
ncbi:DNA-packaging protein [Chelativorans xinjiangense]|uniref:DNA-packaging protein n=1 Tax=Chelativorans xinjiangense TaxID=2681485 RepID=UPI001359032E|nr:DNA-packaging protein [Chelativorans xinjiangense]